ncbi:tRNA (adenosine(37)-N6)-threonylcarbamoyltransferase complex dimerization subunit type 1 TsaB [Leptospira fluminis]|uniref:tRNA (Adenosine(37)-N6)-threonylcarbamoyltransferase complex dimerization subunit type 1 TsaB n=1 Tax=Leptospira fluminis TaxID=2484979 RepID=A0A4R9GSI0_9LEPT|nr:tRNA (adenosine(37)-N6)-threonylcarbamoyltransferase complex dimerization subunit type 1 TsaB [Leptospira fluminis]TGK21144.1 tRNA (adenosine(37)-N6)-threonylcarbamoyltransferase complex dimerization subunit type 1 TsaB [Leptospira fluminis]
MKKILFFDATNRWIVVESFYLSEDGKLTNLQRYSGLHNRESAERLVKEIGICLEESGWSSPDLIVTALGPGSFTGIRISVSTARNFAQIWKIPVLGFDSLEVYSSHYFREEDSAVIVAIEAKQNKIYFALRDRIGFLGSFDIAPTEPAEILPEERLSSYLIARRFTDCPDFFSGENMEDRLPSSESILTESVAQLQSAILDPSRFSFRDLLPNYIRGTYADHKLKVFLE